MFTGIIESLGAVRSVVETTRGRRLEIGMGSVAAEIDVGDSVSVNGVCLTVVGVEGATAQFEVVAETLRRSTLGELEVGDPVNLELPTRAGDRLHGHIVQGHVDGMGTVTDVTVDGEGRRMTITVPSRLRRYLVEKGSVAVDGVSLTVAALHPDGFEVAVIPHTLEVTTLGLRVPGAGVNLEVDVIAKYVESLLGATP
jgi:riboflavin synthase